MEYYDLPFVQGGSREHLLSAAETNTYINNNITEKLTHL